MMSDIVFNSLPLTLRHRVASVMDAVNIATEVRNPKVLLTLLPSATRGFLLQQGKQEGEILMQANHSASFNFSYTSDYPEMFDLYSRAKENQWNGATDLPWNVNVDPENPNIPLLPDSFLAPEQLVEKKVKLTPKEYQNLKYSVVSWMLSQFLHGEQGALLATAQVTESVKWTDGKYYGATQVMDEARHIEVFHRYLSTKLNKMYTINDNLFTIIDALMTDSRWDMKFLGMQIMVEGLALGAFGTIYNQTSEPLLKELLKYVIQDEARHVHYGVLALKKYYEELSEKERIEREDWAFEVALLMRNRFLAHEVYQEWFEGTMSRADWNDMVTRSPGMANFRYVMYSRLIPNLKYIGLLSKRVEKRYEDIGMLKYVTGKNASELSFNDMMNDLDAQAAERELAKAS
ncbi:MAG: ferritin-like domain-containing protein [SAR324 cluster bacterium]|nr:ferritin-like domain-containing protein [SAR324 cluster bacterium]